MKCPKCGCSVMDKPFVRMDKPGPKAVGIFWCEDCCKKHEPEFYKNEMEDKPKVIKDLEKICYGNQQTKSI